MAKSKATESGAQVAALGAAGTVLTAILDALDVGNVAFDEQGWVGVAAIAIGLVYRFAVKWLEARGGSADAAEIDKAVAAVNDVAGSLLNVRHAVTTHDEMDVEGVVPAAADDEAEADNRGD